MRAVPIRVCTAALTAVLLALAAPSAEARSRDLSPGADTLVRAATGGTASTTPTPTATDDDDSPAAFETAVEPEAIPLLITIGLERQRLTVYGPDGRLFDSPISSGTAADPTPTGVFAVIGKAVDHESNLYPGAKMPFMQRLTWTGTALHAGHLPGYPASHGCIRLPNAIAERLYNMTVIGTRVIVTRREVAPVAFAHPALAALAPPPTPAADFDPPPAAGMASSTAAGRPPTIAGRAAAVARVYRPPQPQYDRQAPQTRETRQRLAATRALFETIRPAEDARVATWERVKAANRALAMARLALEQHDAAVPRAGATMVAVAVADAGTRTSPEAGVADGRTEPPASREALVARLAAAEDARRALNDDMRAAHRTLKQAQSAYHVSHRDDVRHLRPVSVLLSRRDGRATVRQGFEPVTGAPLTIADPDRPLGTHVLTAMARAPDGTLLWQAVTLDAGIGLPTTAAAALDRITLPPEVVAAVRERLRVGATLFIADEGPSTYFGAGTDIILDAR